MRSGIAALSDVGSAQAAYDTPDFKDFLSKSISDLPCKDCRYGKLFHGGCRANSLSYLAKMWDIDPICCALSPFVEDEIVPLLPPKLQQSFRACPKGARVLAMPIISRLSAGYGPSCQSSQSMREPAEHPMAETTERLAERPLSALSHPNFRNVWMGQFASQMGSSAHVIGISYFLKETTQSASFVGTAAFLSGSAALLMLPLAGVISDHYNRKFVVLACDGASAATAAILALLFVIATSRGSASWPCVSLSVKQGMAGSCYRSRRRRGSRYS